MADIAALLGGTGAVLNSVLIILSWNDSRKRSKATDKRIDAEVRGIRDDIGYLKGQVNEQGLTLRTLSRCWRVESQRHLPAVLLRRRRGPLPPAGGKLEKLQLPAGREPLGKFPAGAANAFPRRHRAGRGAGFRTRR